MRKPNNPAPSFLILIWLIHPSFFWLLLSFFQLPGKGYTGLNARSTLWARVDK